MDDEKKLLVRQAMLRLLGLNMLVEKLTHNGWSLRVTCNKRTADFWPTTGNYQFTDILGKGNGLDNMIREFESCKPRNFKIFGYDG